MPSRALSWSSYTALLTEATTPPHSIDTKPVAAVIIEPIASEGGDKHASPAFFKGLREVTQKHGVCLIVGEPL